MCRRIFLELSNKMNPAQGQIVGGGSTMTLPNLVRGFVHYGGKTDEYNKLATAARKSRDECEEKIIKTLQGQGMLGANIQITGASLSVIEDKIVPPLTMNNLERYLNEYFSRKGSNFNETDAIMNFIKQQKIGGARTGLKLKKSVAVPGPA